MKKNIENNNTDKALVKKEEKIRESNFELMRIVLLLFVIALHYMNGNMGGILNTKNVSNCEENYYIARIFESFCIVAVNCFVLITGYFSHKQNKIKGRKIIELILIMFFYHIIIYTVSCVTNITTFNKESFQKFMATFYKNNGLWYMYIYIILYLFIPYINLIIKNIGKKEMKLLILIMFIAFCIYPTFFTDTTVKDKGYGIINFILLYFIGAYINIYKVNKRNILLYIIVYILMSTFTYYESIKNLFIVGPFDYNSVFNIISSIALFLVFSKINIKSKFINMISRHTLAIYIIHVNPFICVYNFRNIFKTNMFWHSKFFVIHMMVSVSSIFIICLLIDVIREFIFKKTINKFFDKFKLINHEVEIKNVDQ